MFDVTLSSASVGDIVLDLVANDATATGGIDFETSDFRYSTDGGATWATDGTYVTFPAGNTAIKVEVDSLDDAIDETNETLTLAVSSVVSGTIGDTTDIGIGTISDDDTAGVIVSKAVVDVREEGPTSEVYTVVLTSQPIGEQVTIAITHDTSELAVSPTSLTFTPSDWSTAKPVTVTAVDDTEVENFIHLSTITHVASGAGYDGISVADVTANILDNDGPPPPPVQIIDDGDPGVLDQRCLVVLDEPGLRR